MFTKKTKSSKALPKKMGKAKKGKKVAMKPGDMFNKFQAKKKNVKTA